MLQGLFILLTVISAWSATVTPQNQFKIRDHPPKTRTPGEFRIVFFGDEFAATNYLKLEATLAKRIEWHLRKTSGKNVRVVNAARSRPPLLWAWQSADEILRAYQPDLVLYYLNPVNVIQTAAEDPWIEWRDDQHIAATHYIANEDWSFKLVNVFFRTERQEKEHFLSAMNMQFGILKFTRELAGSSGQLSNFLHPFIRALLGMKNKAEAHHAKFFVLWSGLTVTRLTWSLFSQPVGVVTPWPLVSPLVRKILVTRNQLALELDRNQIPVVNSFQTGSFLRERMFKMPPSQRPIAGILSEEDANTIAESLATAVYARAF